MSEGLVVFSNGQLGVHMTAKIADGTYRIVTARGGIPPGSYQVAISPPVVDHPVGPILEPPKPSVPRDMPRRYHDPETSGFTAVLKDGANVADFDMAP